MKGSYTMILKYELIVFRNFCMNSLSVCLPNLDHTQQLLLPHIIC